jgi:hypothetical protein
VFLNTAKVRLLVRSFTPNTERFKRATPTFRLRACEPARYFAANSTSAAPLVTERSTVALRPDLFTKHAHRDGCGSVCLLFASCLYVDCCYTYLGTFAGVTRPSLSSARR